MTDSKIDNDRLKHRDSFDEEDCSVPDEMEEGIAQKGVAAHRCSMIKKYSTTFFTPAK